MTTENGSEPERAGAEAEVERLLRLAGARPSAPDGAEARVHAAVLAQWRAVRAARRRRMTTLRIAGLAAAVLAVVGVLALRRAGHAPAHAGRAIATLSRVVGSPRTAPEILPAIAPGAAMPAGTAIETGPADRVAVILSDGTTLRIDHETRMRLLEGPLVDLDRGAVYAETADHAKAAGTLRVRTRLGTVSDVGTRFEVRVGGDLLEVSVRAGAARLDRDGASREAGSGSRLVVKKEGTIALQRVPVYGDEWDWTLSVAPEFEIEGRTLGEFLDWAARENGLTVRFEDDSIQPHARATVLHGSIHGMRPDEALGAVLPTCDLQHRFEGEALVVRRAARGSPPS